MATVEMTFTPLPAHVRTARLVATAVARRSGVAEALLDEVRLAVTGAEKRFEVVVTNTAANDDGMEWSAISDSGPDGQGLPAALPGELGLAVIAGLADDVQVSRTGDGLSIRMSWPSEDADVTR